MSTQKCCTALQPRHTQLISIRQGWGTSLGRYLLGSADNLYQHTYYLNLAFANKVTVAVREIKFYLLLLGIHWRPFYQRTAPPHCDGLGTLLSAAPSSNTNVTLTTYDRKLGMLPLKMSNAQHKQEMSYTVASSTVCTQYNYYQQLTSLLRMVWSAPFSSSSFATAKLPS